MRAVDDAIAEYIAEDYHTAKEISEHLSLPFVRISNRLRKMRKSGDVLCTRAIETKERGVKPMKYIANHQ